MSKARKCWGEQPVVYEATGASPGQALRRLGKHLDLGVDEWAHGCVVLSVIDGDWTAELFIA